MPKERIQEIPTKAEIERIEHEFLASRKWWLRILPAQRNEAFSKSSYEKTRALTRNSVRNINRQLQHFLEEGALIVFINENQYQILYPQNQLLIIVDRKDLASRRGFPKILPAYHGKLNAQVKLSEKKKRAYYAITCADQTFTTIFDPQNASLESPALYAVVDNPNLDKIKAIPILYDDIQPQSGIQFLVRKSA